MYGSLYALEGSTLSGSENVSRNTMSHHETKLWHLRLGHMRVRGMYELCKQGLFDGKTFGNLRFCKQCVYGKHKRVTLNPSYTTLRGYLIKNIPIYRGLQESPLLVVVITS